MGTTWGFQSEAMYGVLIRRVFVLRKLGLYCGDVVGSFGARWFETEV